MRQELRQSDVIRLLRKRCEQEGGQAALARKLGLSRQYIEQVLSGKRVPSDAIAATLGIKSDGLRWIKA